MKIISVIRVFDASFRENKTIFSSAPKNGVPVVLESYNKGTYSDIVAEVKEVANEFCQKCAEV